MSKDAGNAEAPEAPEAQEVSESEIAVHWKEEATIYPSAATTSAGNEGKSEEREEYGTET